MALSSPRRLTVSTWAASAASAPASGRMPSSRSSRFSPSGALPRTPPAPASAARPHRPAPSRALRCSACFAALFVVAPAISASRAARSFASLSACRLLVASCSAFVCRRRRAHAPRLRLLSSPAPAPCGRLRAPSGSAPPCGLGPPSLAASASAGRAADATASAAAASSVRRWRIRRGRPGVAGELRRDSVRGCDGAPVSIRRARRRIHRRPVRRGVDCGCTGFDGRRLRRGRRFAGLAAGASIGRGRWRGSFGSSARLRHRVARRTDVGVGVRHRLVSGASCTARPALGRPSGHARLTAADDRRRDHDHELGLVLLDAPCS